MSSHDNIDLMKSTIAFLKLEGEQAGPYASVTVSGISELHQYAARQHFQQMIARDMFGDTTFGTAERNYYVGIHSGRTTYLTVLAYNLGLEEDGKTQKGYVLLNKNMAGSMADALRVAATFVDEAKSGEHPMLTQFPSMRRFMPEKAPALA